MLLENAVAQGGSSSDIEVIELNTNCKLSEVCSNLLKEKAAKEKEAKEKRKVHHLAYTKECSRFKVGEPSSCFFGRKCTYLHGGVPANQLDQDPDPEKIQAFNAQKKVKQPKVLNNKKIKKRSSGSNKVKRGRADGNGAIIVSVPPGRGSSFTMVRGIPPRRNAKPAKIDDIIRTMEILKYDGSILSQVKHSFFAPRCIGARSGVRRCRGDACFLFHLGRERKTECIRIYELLEETN